MLTHARLCKVLACVTLKKRRQFLLFFFFSCFWIGGSFSGWWEGLPAISSWRLIWLYSVFYTSVLPVLLLGLCGLLVQRWLCFWKGWRVRRTAEDKEPRHLLASLHEKGPVQNPVVRARLWTSLDAYLSPFL